MGNLLKCYYGPYSFFCISTKNHLLCCCARLGMSTQVKKDYTNTGIYVSSFLGLKTDFYQKSVNLGMINMLNTIRQSFKK